jgi:hypothetical protein
MLNTFLAYFFVTIVASSVIKVVYCLIGAGLAQAV